MDRLWTIWSFILLVSCRSDAAEIQERPGLSKEWTDPVCPWGFKSLPPGNDTLLCYRAMQPATWADAHQTCHAQGSDVLSIASGFPFSQNGLMSILCDSFYLNLNVSSMWLSLGVIEDRLWWNQLHPSPIDPEDKYYQLPTMIRPEHLDQECGLGPSKLYVWQQGQPSLTTGQCGRLQLELINLVADEMQVTAWLHDCNDELPYVCWNQGMEYSLEPDISGCDKGWVGSVNSAYCLTQPVFNGTFEDAHVICHAYPYKESRVSKPYMEEIYVMMELLPIQGPVWLGAHVENWTVYWLDGHTDSVQSYRWVSQVPESGCLAWVAASWGTEGSIRPCDSEMGVVCVSLLNATQVLAPEVFIEPKEVWASYRDPDSKIDLNFTCQAENIHPTLSVVWVINNYLLWNGPPDLGLLLEINMELAGILAWPITSDLYQTSLIGHYQCHVRGQIPSVLAISQHATLVMYDIAQLAATVVIPEQMYDPLWKDLRLFTGMSSLDWIYQIKLEGLFSYYKDNELYPPLETGIIDYQNTSTTSSGQDVLVVSAIMMYKYHHHQPPQEAQEPSVWLEEWQDDVFSLVSHTVNQRLTENNYILDDYYGQTQTRIDDIELSIIDSLPGSQYCGARMKMSNGIKPLHWNKTYAGEVANSTETCMWDGLPLASCACVNGPNSQVYWGPVIFANCNPSHTSEVTERLEDLTKDDITVSNAQEVSGHLVNLTTNSDILTPADIVYTAQIVENLVAMKAVPVQVGDDILATINQAMGVNEETLVKAQLADNSSNRIISSLNQFASTTNMTGSNSTLLVQPQVALGVYDVSEALLTSGLAVLTDPGSGFRLGNVVPLNTDHGETDNTKLVDSAVLLPEDVIQRLKLEKEAQDDLLQTTMDPSVREDILNHPVRISFTAFAHSNLFVQSVELTDVATSSVISGSIHSYRMSRVHTADSGRNDVAFQDQIRLVFRTEANADGACVFWNFQANDGRGNWSREGCRMISYDATHTSCACNHLTNFAVLMDVNRSPVSATHATILSYISVIGLSLSIVGLTLTLLTFIVFRKDFLSRRSQLSDNHVDKHILFNLCVALLAMYIVFLAGIERTENTTACKVVSGLLQYLLLAAFGWMLVEGVRQFLRYYNRSHCLPEKFILKGSIVGWGIPLIIVVSIGAADSSLMISNNFCWVHDEALYYGLLLPLGLIIVTNTVLYSLAIYRITCGRMASSNARNSLVGHLRVSVILFVLLGVTWIFGFFAIADARMVFQYLFCIFNSIQGFLIFWFHCLRDPRVRRNWMNLCHCGKCQVCFHHDNLVSDTDTETSAPSGSTMTLTERSNSKMAEPQS